MADDKNKYILSINGMSKSFGRNKVNAKGYPILLWQYNREDYNTDITGH